MIGSLIDTLNSSPARSRYTGPVLVTTRIELTHLLQKPFVL